MKNQFKAIPWVFTLILICTEPFSSAHGPTVNVKGLSTGDHKGTSITIRKESSQESKRPEFTILKGGQEIEGEPSVNSKDAYQNWKTACNEWKKETKDLNKNNEVLTLDCGRSALTKVDFSQKLVRSNGQYQIKVRMGNTPEKAELATTPSSVDDDDEEDDLGE